MAAPRFKKTGPRVFSLEFYSTCCGGVWIPLTGQHYFDLEDAEKAALDMNSNDSVYEYRAAPRKHAR